MGHLNRGQLKELVQHSVGIDIDQDSDFDFVCDECTKAKQTRRPYPKESTTTCDQIGELTYFDTWGPTTVASTSGNNLKYYISFTDAKTRISAIKGMKTRDEALRHFKSYQARIENQANVKLKKARCDNAKEFVEGDFKKYPDEQGIVLETTAPYSPAQNGSTT